MNAQVGRDNIVTQSLGQIGDCGLFLLKVLAAVPRSLRHARETVRQLWFVGAMSLTIIMVCGLFVGMVLALQLYHVLSIFGGTAATGTVVAIASWGRWSPRCCSPAAPAPRSPPKSA
jgi:phospholipid/cholesterol/gamma-HCH transport system permease protein